MSWRLTRAFGPSTQASVALESKFARSTLRIPDLPHYCHGTRTSPAYVMNRWLLVGAVNGFLAVAAGAFAAHGLESSVAPSALELFQTGAHYHLTHALALVATSLIARPEAMARANLAAWFFTVGIVLFSGSLYFMVLTGSNALALVTPLGGLSLLAGW